MAGNLKKGGRENHGERWRVDRDSLGQRQRQERETMQRPTTWPQGDVQVSWSRAAVRVTGPGIHSSPTLRDGNSETRRGRLPGAQLEEAGASAHHLTSAYPPALAATIVLQRIQLTVTACRLQLAVAPCRAAGPQLRSGQGLREYVAVPVAGLLSTRSPRGGPGGAGHAVGFFKFRFLQNRKLCDSDLSCACFQ